MFYWYEEEEWYYSTSELTEDDLDRAVQILQDETHKINVIHASLNHKYNVEDSLDAEEKLDAETYNKYREELADIYIKYPWPHLRDIMRKEYNAEVLEPNVKRFGGTS